MLKASAAMQLDDREMDKKRITKNTSRSFPRLVAQSELTVSINFPVYLSEMLFETNSAIERVRFTYQSTLQVSSCKTSASSEANNRALWFLVYHWLHWRLSQHGTENARMGGQRT